MKYLSFHNSSFCLKILFFNVNGKGQSVWHTPLFVCLFVGDVQTRLCDSSATLTSPWFWHLHDLTPKRTSQHSWRLLASVRHCVNWQIWYIHPPKNKKGGKTLSLSLSLSLFHYFSFDSKPMKDHLKWVAIFLPPKENYSSLLKSITQHLISFHPTFSTTQHIQFV